MIYTTNESVSAHHFTKHQRQNDSAITSHELKFKNSSNSKPKT